MKQCGTMIAALLLLLALCACGSHEAKLAGTWQGDGSLDVGMAAEDGPAPFNGAERWVFDGEETAVATVNGSSVTLHYYATDDTLTFNDGGEVSWGVAYELKGSTLRIGGAEYTKAE